MSDIASTSTPPVASATSLFIHDEAKYRDACNAVRIRDPSVVATPYTYQYFADGEIRLCHNGADGRYTYTAFLPPVIMTKSPVPEEKRSHIMVHRADALRLRRWSFGLIATHRKVPTCLVCYSCHEKALRSDNLPAPGAACSFCGLHDLDVAWNGAAMSLPTKTHCSSCKVLLSSLRESTSLLCASCSTKP